MLWSEIQPHNIPATLALCEILNLRGSAPKGPTRIITWSPCLNGAPLHLLQMGLIQGQHVNIPKK